MDEEANVSLLSGGPSANYTEGEVRGGGGRDRKRRKKSNRRKSPLKALGKLEEEQKFGRWGERGAGVFFPSLKRLYCNIFSREIKQEIQRRPVLFCRLLCFVCFFSVW